ncbi:MAG TPA: NUDIX hydrolase [Candidatus Poseidoniales archaeon]|nr:NUDIX hydrolase [Candidatus Poseidoniales archaeon]
MKDDSIFVYLEYDGKVFTVDSSGKGPVPFVPGRLTAEVLVRLPTIKEAREAGLEWVEKRRNDVRLQQTRYTVIMASPIMPQWPKEWPWKDDAISDSGADPALRECVYRTLHRVVAKVIIMNDSKKVLLGKVNRGHFTGAWTLPGGYVDYPEHPADGAVRETFEEAGLPIEIHDGHDPNGWVVVQEQIFDNRGIEFISFTYRTTVVGCPDVTPKADEIDELRWFPLDEAQRIVPSIFDRYALEQASVK